MSKFTKWRLEGFEQVYAATGHFYGGLIVDEDENIIAQNVMPAHALIIYKAPKMLELLKYAITHRHPSYKECVKWYEDVEAVIKEIEGE